MNLTSMKLSPSEAKTETGDVSVEANRPEYPYGLCLQLDDQALTKLGITGLPSVGDLLALTARVEVNSVSEYESQGDQRRRSVSLQITDLGLGPLVVAVDPGKLYPTMQGK